MHALYKPAALADLAAAACVGVVKELLSFFFFSLTTPTSLTTPSVRRTACSRG